MSMAGLSDDEAGEGGDSDKPSGTAAEPEGGAGDRGDVDDEGEEGDGGVRGRVACVLRQPHTHAGDTSRPNPTCTGLRRVRALCTAHCSKPAFLSHTRAPAPKFRLLCTVEGEGEEDSSDSDDDEANASAMDLKGLAETDPEFFNFLQVRVRPRLSATSCIRFPPVFISFRLVLGLLRNCSCSSGRVQ